MASLHSEPDLDWEELEGIPQVDDPFVQQYLNGRLNLIEEEGNSRSDASFRASLSPMAREACEIVHNIRQAEHGTIWNGEDVADGHIFPGMPFGLARDRMEKSVLWKVVHKMPKGALLHAHIDAMTDPEWLLEEAIKTKGMAFHADQPLTSAKALADAKVSFRYVGPAYKLEAPSIWTSDYTAGSLNLASEVASLFSDIGKSGFVEYMVSKITISVEESLDHHHGIDAIWRKFASTFPIIGSMLHHEPIFRQAVRRLLGQLLDDGICWVDFRCAFINPSTINVQEGPEEALHACFVAFEEELEKFKSANPSFWGARFIWTSLRSWDRKGVISDMKKCLQIKLDFPELISGFDLVGQEDAGRSLVDLLPELLWFRKSCAEMGVTIPFFFHAGECLGTGSETDENLFDAVLLGTRRIGHGFSLYKHPLLVEMVKKKHILIESCPISNEILRLSGSILHHPLPALLARGVKCALSNDDPAILGHGANGLTGDFWQALQGWDSLGLAGLGSLAEDSVRFAAYAPDLEAKQWLKEVREGLTGEGARGDRLRDWRKQWEDFCAWVVREYAVDYGSFDGEEES